MRPLDRETELRWLNDVNSTEGPTRLLKPAVSPIVSLDRDLL